MSADKRRVMVSLTPELALELDDVKRKLFFDKPYSEVYRYVFSLGLKAAQEQDSIKTGEMRSDNGSGCQ